MSLRNFNGFEIFLLVTGSAITVLYFEAATAVFRHAYSFGFLFFAVATTLAFVLFRGRKTALAVVSLSFVYVNVGLTFLFHPSVLGLALIVGSASGMYLLVRWGYGRYPYLSKKHWHTIFEGEAAMKAENARIEAEARELVKSRPFGPWLIR